MVRRGREEHALPGPAQGDAGPRLGVRDEAQLHVQHTLRLACLCELRHRFHGKGARHEQDLVFLLYCAKPLQRARLCTMASSCCSRSYGVAHHSTLPTAVLVPAVQATLYFVEE